MSQSTLLTKHNKRTMCAFSISSLIVGRAFIPFNALDNPCGINRVCILIPHKLRSFLSSKFSTLNFIIITGLTALDILLGSFIKLHLGFSINLLWTWGFSLVWLTMPIFINERDSICYIIKEFSVRRDIRYNSWAQNQSHGFPLLVSTRWTRAVAPSGVSHSFSHLYPFHIIFTNSSQLHNFSSSCLKRYFLHISLFYKKNQAIKYFIWHYLSKKCVPGRNLRHFTIQLLYYHKVH